MHARNVSKDVLVKEISALQLPFSVDQTWSR